MVDSFSRGVGIHVHHINDRLSRSCSTQRSAVSGKSVTVNVPTQIIPRFSCWTSPVTDSPKAILSKTHSDDWCTGQFIGYFFHNKDHPARLHHKIRRDYPLEGDSASAIWDHEQSSQAGDFDRLVERSM